jgi:glycosyltransferase involved in cell wall biosynthesis
MQRVIFLNRFFFPDHSATSQMLSDLAFNLAAAGREVHVVTSQQKYDEPKTRLAYRETINRVHITRVATSRFGRSALFGRGVDYLSFYSAMWRAVLALIRPGDILVAKTDPPLTSILAMRAAKLRGARLVNWLQDLFPEVAVQLGVPFLRGSVGRCLTSLRDQSLRAAVANVVLGDLMAQRVMSRGISPERVHVIPNWSDDEQISPISHNDNHLRREWKLEDKFVVGYSGNLGRAHEFDTILAAAELLRDDPRIIFLPVPSIPTSQFAAVLAWRRRCALAFAQA